MRYRDLVEDGHVPGLLVHPDWWEPKHPQEIPVTVDDPIALYRPAPEISIPEGYGLPDQLDGRPVLGVFTDDFNRPDSLDLGPNWINASESSTFLVSDPSANYSEAGIISGRVYETDRVDEASQFLNGYNYPGTLFQYGGPPVSPNQYAQYEMYNFSQPNGAPYGYQTIGFILRGDLTTENGLFLYLEWGETFGWDLYAYIATFTDDNYHDFIFSAEYLQGVLDTSDGTILRVEAVGNTVSLYVGGTQILTDTRSAHRDLSTVGVWLQSYTEHPPLGIDNFEVGEMVELEGVLAQSLAGGETQIVVEEALTYEIGKWIFIDIDGGGQHKTRIASTSNSPAFTIPLTTAFPDGSAATAGNSIYIGGI